MAEIYGRSDGLCGGYGGSMHLVDPERGFLGTSGIVGQGIPQATGAAYAAQIRRQGQVVLSLLRRRRLQAGRVLGVAQRRLAVEAADRLRDGEQLLQRRHPRRAGGRERRRRRAAGGQGEGVLDARGDGRRRRPARRPRAGRRGGRARALGRGTDARRVEGLPAERPRQHHRPAGRAAALPRARGDRGVRRPRGVRGGPARRPGAALPRPARHRRDAQRGGGRPRSPSEVRAEMQAAVRVRARQPVPRGRRRPLNHVYA